MLVFLSLVMLIGGVFAQENSISEDEALFLRRITEFYEEKEFNIVFNQGKEFLKQYPKSDHADELRILLGDLSVEMEKYTSALNFYTSIEDGQKRESVFFNTLDCYYHRKDYEKIVQSCRQLLDSNKSLDKEDSDRANNIYALTLFKLMQDDSSNKYQINEAITIFNKLQDTKYDISAKEHLAYLFTEKKAYKKATDLYFSLASKVEDKKEDFLFLAAQNATNYDLDLAIKTYGQICYLEGEKANAAALNRLFLFFENNKFADIVLAKDQIFELLPQEKKPIYHYILGRSHFALDDYTRAKDQLLVYLDQKSDNTERYNAHIYLLGCAQREKNIELMNEVVRRAEVELEGDKLFCEILFARALLHKELKNYSLAEKDFEKIVEKKFPLEKEMLFEWAHMYIESEKPLKGQSLFREYVTKYPDETHAPLAWHYLLFCSLKQAEEEAVNESEHKLVFVKDLQDVLKTDLSDSERTEYLYLLGKTNFQLKKYDDAIKSFAYLIKTFPSSKHVSMSSLYMGYAYRDGKKDVNKFVQLAEQALEKPEQISSVENVYASLYNAYLHLLEKNTSNSTYKDKAAANLFKLYSVNPQKVSIKNQLWLASFYHEKVKENASNQEALKTGIALFEEALKGYKGKTIEPSDQFIEPHLLRLSELYHYSEDKNKEIEVLNDLCQFYDQSADLKWEYEDRAYYYLANVIKDEDKKKAISLYEKVGKSPFKNSSVAGYAILEGAKLKKQLDQSDDQLLALDLINQLKNLSIQRRLDTEPVHLEATLELVELMCDSESDELAKNKKELHLLEQMKTRFLSTEDVIGKDYAALREKDADKEALFQGYMLYLDVRIKHLQTKLCEKNEKNELEKEANRLLKELSSKQQINPYLDARINSLSL